VVGDGDASTVEQRKVRLGRVMGEDRQVLSGLAAGDSVVLDPPATLQDGDKVRVAANNEQAQ
jgi:multidrug efflux pump subunit AcrA (membrane-fusion protein)